MTAVAAPQINFAHVSYRYPEQTRPALSRVDWTVNEGEFVIVAGPSGSGKSTLLRCLNGLVPHFSGGQLAGAVAVGGIDTRDAGPRALARRVGFVFQDPEAQLVTHRVEDEIAFGMEQLGVPRLTMRKRVEEVLDLMGIAALRHRDVSTLSGGERQRVAVAAALSLQPAVLALDEPTSQLDPWGAEDVLTALNRLNEDLGLTIVLAEHRLERVIGHADRLRMLTDEPAVIFDGSPREVLTQVEPVMTPPLVRLGRALGWEPLPMTIKEGREAARRDPRRPGWPPPGPVAAGVPIVQVSDVHAGYGHRLVLRGVDLELRPGELVALMGRNGSGKTTLLRSLIGFHKIGRGRITVFGRDAMRTDPADLASDIGYVPQNPSALLFAETVSAELDFTLRQHHGQGRNPQQLLQELGLASTTSRHPRDLSGGERQRLALAAALVAAPKLLLLDEPTRGMDYARKESLGAVLTRLRTDGVTIVMATHDVELVAAIATRVVLIGDGGIVADGSPREVLSGSLTFATQINKLYGDGWLTADDVINGLDSAFGGR